MDFGEDHRVNTEEFQGELWPIAEENPKSEFEHPHSTVVTFDCITSDDRW